MTDEKKPMWACYVREPDIGWVVDTCAEGRYDFDVSQAKWWLSREDMRAELEASDLIYSDKYVVEVDRGTWEPVIKQFTSVRVR
jgi:hypothetical protein